jgi:hypothetical protein
VFAEVFARCIAEGLFTFRRVNAGKPDFILRAVNQERDCVAVVNLYYAVG